MSKKSFIDSIRVASPCSQDWDSMHGNDQVRFCDHCAKRVNNLSQMTTKDALRLVRRSNGRLCIRYIADPNTKAPLFADQLSQITRRAPGLATGVITASIALSTAAYAQEPQPNQTPPPPATSSNQPNVPGKNESKPNDETQPPQNVTLQTETISVTMGKMVSIAREYKNPLMVAVQNEDLDKIKDLIVHGANVNGKEDDKSTPLFIAVGNGNVEIVRMLLDFGAKINARDSGKKTPLMRLDDDSAPELVGLLLDQGAKINLTDNDGNTALILTAGRVKPEVLQRLIDAGADVNLSNNDGQTAIMNAADEDGLEKVRMLLLAGANPNLKNKDGETAWDLTSNDEIEELLVSYGADVKEKPDAGGQTDPPRD